MLKERFKKLICYLSLISILISNFSIITVNAAEHNFSEVKEFEFSLEPYSYSFLDIRYKAKIPLDNFKAFANIYNSDIDWDTITDYKVGELVKVSSLVTPGADNWDIKNYTSMSVIDDYIYIDFSEIDFLNTGSILMSYTPSYEKSFYFEILEDGTTLGWNVYPQSQSHGYISLISLDEANVKSGTNITTDFVLNSNLDFSYTDDLIPTKTILESNMGTIVRGYYPSYESSLYNYSDSLDYNRSNLYIEDSNGNDVTEQYNYYCGPLTESSSGSSYEYMLLISDGSSSVGNTKFTLKDITIDNYSYNFYFVVGELPHEHLFMSTTFDWSDDYSTCTTDLICECNFILEDVPCDINLTTIEQATCSKSGSERYDAMCPLEYNGYSLTNPLYTVGYIDTPNFTNYKTVRLNPTKHIYTTFESLDTYSIDDFTGAKNYTELKEAGYYYSTGGYNYSLNTSLLNEKSVYKSKCKNYDDCGEYIIKVTDNSCTTETTSTTVEPTCTEDGYTDYLIDCPDCGFIFFEGRDTISKLGHDLKTVWTAPTLVTKEKKTDSCKRDNCSYSTTEEFDYAMGSFAFGLYDLDLHYLDKNIEFISTSDNLSGSYNPTGGLIDFDLDFSEKDAYYTQLKIVEDDAIYQLPIKLFVDSDGLLDIELSGGTTLHYKVYNLLRIEELIETGIIPSTFSALTDDTNTDTEDVTYIGYENLYKVYDSIYVSPVLLELIESEKFNLKVIDKFGDTEEERLSEQNFEGYEYSFAALSKDGYTVVGDSIQSGTLSEDTTIIFNYEKVKPKYNLEVQDIYYDSSEKDEATAKIETRYKEQVEEGTPYSYTALVKEGYTADGETTYEGTVSADTVIKFNYIKDEVLKQKYKVKVIDTFGTVDELREEKELEAGASYSYTALEKEGWLVDGNSSYSGTITEDTTIQFFYVEDTISNTEDEKVTIKVFDHFDDSIETRVNKEVDKGSKYSYSPLDKDGWVAKNDEEKTGVANKDIKIHFYYEEDAVVIDKPTQPVTKDTPKSVTKDTSQPEEPKTGDDSNYYALLILLLPVLALFINKSQKR